MDRNELVEKAAVAISGAPFPSAKSRRKAGKVLDAILPDVIEAVQAESAQIAEREAEEARSVDAKFALENAASKIRAAALGDALKGGK